MNSMSPKKLVGKKFDSPIESKPRRLIKLGSPWESLLWSIRVGIWEREFPKSYKELDWSDSPSYADLYRGIDTWKFLAPFFASRGYNLYHKADAYAPMLPDPSSPDTPLLSAYPFSRIILRDTPARLLSSGPSTWGACDKLGRHVVIKAISDVSRPSNEFNILKRLNDEKLRGDPFNHTIYALEFLTFDELVFVVMPRWDGAFFPDFGTVYELLEMTRFFLEVYVFLHKHRIVHHDFLEQNTGINVVINSDSLLDGYKGLRVPGEVRYTLFDFGYSVMYPEDSVIEDVTETRFLGFGLRDAPPLAAPYNPFKADIALMGLVLQCRVRHVEHVVPELGPFFDRLVDPTDPSQLTAPQALSRFNEIFNTLSGPQLQEPVLTWLWIEGVSVEKGKNYRGDP